MKNRVVTFILALTFVLSVGFAMPRNVYATGYVESDIESFVGKVVADMDNYLTNPFYQKNEKEKYNPYCRRYYNNGSKKCSCVGTTHSGTGQCVGYAVARTEDKLKMSGVIGSTGEYAKDIPAYYEKNSEGKTITSYMTGIKYTIHAYQNDEGKNLISNCWASFKSSSTAGHVIFVEEVINNNGVKYIYYTEGGANLSPGVLKKKKLSDFMNLYKGYVGCVTFTPDGKQSSSTPEIKLPVAPTGLTATKANDKTAKISWNAVSGATSYQVEYQTHGSSPVWKTDADYKTKTATSYTSTGLGTYDSFKYRVRAVNSAGSSGWSEITYNKAAATVGIVTINYNANGGGGAPSSHNVTKDSSGVAKFNLSSTKPTRSGYSFLGWRLDNNASSSLRPPSQSISVTTSNATSDTTLTYYAQWEAATITTGTVSIQYNANGGSGAPSSHNVTKDGSGVVKFNLSSTTPSKSGYTFQGWRLENSTAYGIDNPGQSIAIGLGSPTSNATLTYYAQWGTAAQTYIITYDANGGNGTPSNQTFTAGSKVVLSSTKPTRSGYNFIGWGTKPTSTLYEAYFVGEAYSFNGDVRLYALWFKLEATPTPTAKPTPIQSISSAIIEAQPTPIATPSVKLNSVTNITASGARIEFTVNNPGGLSINDLYVCLDVSSDVGNEYKMGTINSANKNIYSGLNLSGLGPATTFYYRVFITQGGERYYSEISSFTTLAK